MGQLRRASKKVIYREMVGKRHRPREKTFHVEGQKEARIENEYGLFEGLQHTSVAGAGEQRKEQQALSSEKVVKGLLMSAMGNVVVLIRCVFYKGNSCFRESRLQELFRVERRHQMLLQSMRCRLTTCIGGGSGGNELVGHGIDFEERASLLPY